MRIYLDCCCIQRPFDDRSQPRIAIESEAVITILSLCEEGSIELVNSDVLMYEINRIPDVVRKDDALAILGLAEEMIELDNEIESLSEMISGSGIKPVDALHIASASAAGVDYFCTCDDKLLRAAEKLENINTKVLSPTELVMELDK